MGRPPALIEGLPVLRYTGPQAVRSFIEAAAKVAHEEHQAVGAGRDVRFEGNGISGYALIGEAGVLHAAAFAG